MFPFTFVTLLMCLLDEREPCKKKKNKEKLKRLQILTSTNMSGSKKEVDSNMFWLVVISMCLGGICDNQAFPSARIRVGLFCVK